MRKQGTRPETHGHHRSSRPGSAGAGRPSLEFTFHHGVCVMFEAIASYFPMQQRRIPWRVTATAALGLSVLLVAGPALALDAVLIPVMVEARGKDDIGRQLASAIRESIRASAGYRLVVEQSETPLWTLHVITVDPGPPNGLQTAYSVTYAVGALYFTSVVGICGQDVVQECAAKLLSNLDRYETALQKAEAGRNVPRTN